MPFVMDSLPFGLLEDSRWERGFPKMTEASHNREQMMMAVPTSVMMMMQVDPDRSYQG